MYTGMILDNAINKGRELITEKDLEKLIKINEGFKKVYNLSGGYKQRWGYNGGNF